MSTTDEDQATEVELDLLAWNLPAPRDAEPQLENPWRRPFPPLADDEAADEKTTGGGPFDEAA